VGCGSVGGWGVGRGSTWQRVSAAHTHIHTHAYTHARTLRSLSCVGGMGLSHYRATSTLAAAAGVSRQQQLSPPCPHSGQMRLRATHTTGQAQQGGNIISARTHARTAPPSPPSPLPLAHTLSTGLRQHTEQPHLSCPALACCAQLESQGVCKIDGKKLVPAASK
jgi:hypothetical protein